MFGAFKKFKALELKSKFVFLFKCCVLI